MQTVEVAFSVNGNTLTITPAKGSFSDNSLYEISIGSLTAIDGTDLGSFKAKEITAITPLYCHVYDVRALLGELDVPDDQIVYYIRDASKYSDFITKATSTTTGTPDYEVVQLVRYKAAREAVLRYYILHSEKAGSKGMIGELSFEMASSTPDLKNLLAALATEIKRWEDAVRGHIVEGKAKPKSVQRALKGSALSTITSYVSGTDRGGVGGY